MESSRFEPFDLMIHQILVKVPVPSLGLLLRFIRLHKLRLDRGEATLPSGSLPRVAVLPFDNATFRRGLEIELTRLLADEVRARSPRAPAGPDDADWLVRGTILRADERIYSEDENDLVRESSIVLEVEVTLIAERDSSTEVITPTVRRFEVTHHCGPIFG